MRPKNILFWILTVKINDLYSLSCLSLNPSGPSRQLPVSPVGSSSRLKNKHTKKKELCLSINLKFEYYMSDMHFSGAETGKYPESEHPRWSASAAEPRVPGGSAQSHTAQYRPRGRPEQRPVGSHRRPERAACSHLVRRSTTELCAFADCRCQWQRNKSFTTESTTPSARRLGHADLD